MDVRERINTLTSNIDAIAPYIQEFGLCQAEHVLEIRGSTEKLQIAEDLVPILAKIPVGQLRSFRWDIRTNCPKSIISNLHTHQKNLETIIIYHPTFDRVSEATTFTHKLKNLVTSPKPFTFDLQVFQNLRHLCIYGHISSEAKQRLMNQLPISLKTLKTFIMVHLPHGHHLWPLFRRVDTSNIKKSKSFMGITYPYLETFADDNNAFGAILSKHLNLESISQFPNLRAFHSRFFLSSTLLSNFDPKVPIRLRTLEVQGCSIEILSNFLLAFQGLQDLDVLVLPGEDYPDPVPILHHAETLKRLVLWKVGQPFGRLPRLAPIPFALVRSLGKGLGRLEEFCATIPPEHDPFEGNLFSELKLLWLYNTNSKRSNIDSASGFPWIPPTTKYEIKSHPQWVIKNQTLQLDITAHPNLTIPRNLKALAIGHYNRVVDLEAEANPNHIVNSNRTERLYERVKEGNDTVIWKRIGMRELVRKYPDLISPYEDAFGVPLMKRYVLVFPT
ncbi:hypothetical protein TWF192_000984 [Orbilia oligospora]|uniref:Uncharacterized protein n=1 Tax=Orbilia oligospora TaxID=2813651 RepID=A0A6G1MIV8_ORBOL|nr:hypothetical protein TWF679_008774 [Orbilia oligospora]KAF3231539.1 hypothetical protein TWF191_005609 [Orbilia oligospora]KAF3257693.1 hypothetical protein TWF192_000984 [Orbilia oligospora]